MKRIKSIVALNVCLSLIVMNTSIIAEELSVEETNAVETNVEETNVVEVNVEETNVEEMNVDVSTREMDVTADFEDLNFRKWVVENYGDGTKVTAGDLATVGPQISPINLGIESLAGLEHFSQVITLNLTGSNFPTFNLADLPDRIKNLTITNSNISVLNTEGGHFIEQLTINGNPLTELDLAPLTSVFTLNAQQLKDITEIDFSVAPQLKTITLNGTSSLTTIDVSAQVNMNNFSVTGVNVRELKLPVEAAGKGFFVFAVAKTELEHVENAPASAYFWNTGGQEVKKELMLNDSNQYYIQMHAKSIITEENLAIFEEGEVVFDPEKATLTWVNEEDPETIIATYDGQVLFNNDIGAQRPLTGRYILMPPAPKPEPEEKEEDIYHTVNFRNCEGEIIGQAWPLDGTDITSPNGYVYETSVLTNVTFSKDVTPVNCSGGFVIPNTGR